MAHQRSVDETLAALRAGAQLKFSAAMEEPSRQVSEEFEGVMAAMEEKRRSNVERASRLSEQIVAISLQIDSLQRSMAASRPLPPQHNAKSELLERAERRLTLLKSEVRGAWGLVPRDDRIRFLSRCLRHAPYSGPLYAALAGKAAELRRVKENISGGKGGGVRVMVPPSFSQQLLGKAHASSSSSVKDRMLEAQRLLGQGLQSPALHR